MTRSLLFIDDPQSPFHQMRDYFESRGLEVDCATEPEEALALVEWRPYSLLVLDVSLAGPQGSEGTQLVDDLSAARPNARVIILSGEKRQILDQSGFDPDRDRSDQTFAAFAAVVEEMIAEREEARYADAC